MIDSGKEMAEHKLFTEETKMQVYFCDPHSSWQRGTNDNTNMLIRDFFPKQTDFSKFARRNQECSETFEREAKKNIGLANSERKI
jgi:IS30 family transposase